MKKFLCLMLAMVMALTVVACGKKPQDNNDPKGSDLKIGLISGLVAHKLGKINQQTNWKKLTGWVIGAAVAGLLFNCVFDPLIGYYYKLLILGKPAAELTLAWNIGATTINAVLSTVVASAVYLALRPALVKAGILQKIWGQSFEK